MLISKTAMVRWNGYTRKYYESKGYTWTKQNEYFECSTKDLMHTSTARVQVKCDYCKEHISEKQYRNYLIEREIISKDCCKSRKCMVQKSEEVNSVKYGVKNYNQRNESKENLRSIFQTPLVEVQEYCLKRGMIVLNMQDYQNDRTRLSIICLNHPNIGIQETNFANLKKNKRCCFHGGTDVTAEKRRNSGEDVFNAFVSVGLLPKFNPRDYSNNSQMLPFICPKHVNKGIQYRSYGNLRMAEGCVFCSKERTATKLRTPKEEVFSYFISRGLHPLENEIYKNKETHIKHKCEKHPEKIQSISYSSLQNTKTPCKYCREEKTIITLNRRFRSSIGEWKRLSELSCDNRCVLTGGSKYEIHHLYSYNNIIKEALVILEIKNKESYSCEELELIKNKVLELHSTYPLGVCLAKEIHILFHSLYGKNDNIPQQFEEFKLRYKMGEFDYFLEGRDGEVMYG